MTGRRPGERTGFRVSDEAPVFAISVAAELAGLHAQTLRQYDRIGLVRPTRVGGRNRLYSANDIARLREIALLSSEGLSLEGIRRVLALQTDPYTVAPLVPDAVSMAGLQARLGLDAGKWTKEQMAQVALESLAVTQRTDSEKSAKNIDELLARPFFSDPLHRHDIAPITDGASIVVLAADDRARELRERPAWITGFEHRIETPVIGARDLTTSPSTAASAALATGGDTGSIDVAEIYAAFTHQQLILTEAIGLKDSTKINPSGGALAANPMFSTGLERIGYAARHLFNGSAQRVLAHATSGPVLQQNLVAVLEGKS